MENYDHLFCMKITELVFPSLQNTWVSLEKAEGFVGEWDREGHRMAHSQFLGSVQLEIGFQHYHVPLWMGFSWNGWWEMAAPASSLPSGLSGQTEMELIASDHEWKPLCPRKGISSDFWVFQEYPWRVRLAWEIAIPEWLQFFLSISSEICTGSSKYFFSKSAFICRILILYFLTFKLFSLMF